MPILIDKPSLVEAAGNKSKKIEEYIGRITTEHSELSIARMTSPEGWEEPGQCPDFTEFTVVLRGTLVVEHNGGIIEVNSGQCVITHSGEWVRYSTPKTGGAEYIAVCLPAFSPDTVHRDTD